MKAALKKKWIAALRSGKYKQGKSAMYKKEANTFCCLGVLRHVATGRNEGLQDDGASVFSERALSTLGLTDRQQWDLAHRNDGIYSPGQWSFARIATWIEKHL